MFYSQSGNPDIVGTSVQTCPDEVPHIGNEAGTSVADETSVEVVRDCERLEQLRPVWSRWARHPNADMDFYLTVLRSGKEMLRPHILVLYRYGQPQAMLIGRLEQSLIRVKVGYQTVMKLPARMITFIHGGLLGTLSIGDEERLIVEVYQSLRRGEGDVAFLSHFNAQSNIVRSAKRFPSLFTRDYVPVLDTHRSITLPKASDELYRRMSKANRKGLKRRMRMLEGDFGATVNTRCFRHPAEIDNALREIEQIARKTYQRGLGVGFESTEEVQSRMRLAANKGWLRIYILYLKGIPCAFWIGTQYQRVFHGNFVGYDPEYARYSPGMFLMMTIIERFCDSKEEGVDEVDFGLGDAEYKRALCNSEWQEGSVFIFAPTFHGIKLNFARTPPEMLSRFATKVLARSGILPQIKRAWRNLAIREH